MYQKLLVEIHQPPRQAGSISLTLFWQKMEIKTEADDVDEGVSPNDLRPLLGVANKWTSPRVRKKLRTALSFSKSQSTYGHRLAMVYQARPHSPIKLGLKVSEVIAETANKTLEDCANRCIEPNLANSNCVFIRELLAQAELRFIKNCR
uniref:Uncharacterized protein n=1 Tax=Timema cristinae TaxID=61476 RepID=A0A7R9CHD1_TIMCR|nr:unnamed protein product [Timema cristinae]